MWHHHGQRRTVELHPSRCARAPLPLLSLPAWREPLCPLHPVTIAGHGVPSGAPLLLSLQTLVGGFHLRSPFNASAFADQGHPSVSPGEPFLLRPTSALPVAHGARTTLGSARVTTSSLPLVSITRPPTRSPASDRHLWSHVSLAPLLPTGHQMPRVTCPSAQGVRGEIASDVTTPSGQCRPFRGCPLSTCADVYGDVQGFSNKWESDPTDCVCLCVVIATFI